MKVEVCKEVRKYKSACDLSANCCADVVQKRGMLMRTKIKRCVSCGKYTLEDICPSCGAKTVNPLPPRFSPTDRYGRYRRMLKRMTMKE